MLAMQGWEIGRQEGKVVGRITALPLGAALPQADSRSAACWTGRGCLASCPTTHLRLAVQLVELEVGGGQDEAHPGGVLRRMIPIKN